MNEVKLAEVNSKRFQTSTDSLSCMPGSDARNFKVCWTVNAQKVRGNEKQTVSPYFELPLGPRGESMKLRLAIYPKTFDLRAAVNFKSSKGQGYIQLKCELEKACSTAPVRFTLSVGAGQYAQGVRGPVEHDFAKDSISGLPRQHDDWQFKSAKEARSMTFPIFLEIAQVNADARSFASS